MLPGPSERTLSINEEDLEGGFRNWNTANKGPEDLFKSEQMVIAAMKLKDIYSLEGKL